MIEIVSRQINQTFSKEDLSKRKCLEPKTRLGIPVKQFLLSSRTLFLEHKRQQTLKCGYCAKLPKATSGRLLSLDSNRRFAKDVYSTSLRANSILSFADVPRVEKQTYIETRNNHKFCSSDLLVQTN